MSGQDRMADAGARPLTDEETAAVSGGMKWTRGTRSPYVIDARGGSFTIFGMEFTLDVNGKVSSVSPAK